MLNEQDDQQTKIVNAAIIIQKWFRGIQTRISFQSFSKNMFLRKKVIQQMMQTQQNYIGDLALIISDFKMQLQLQKILTKAQNQIIFCNIDEIRKLNQQFYVGLYNQYSIINDKPYVQIFKDTYKQISFFKIYFEYFNNFQNANNLIIQLQKTNQRFDKFLQQKRVNKKYRNLSLADYLIKPVQRLPKYVILLKQLKKRTPQSHPDYPNIIQLLTAFQDVNNSNNQKLNKVLNNYKLAQIQSTLQIRGLTQPGIDFVGQQPVTILSRDHKSVQAIMYLLNNQIIIRKIRSSTLLQRVYLTHGTSLLQDEDGFYFKNTLCVQNSQGDSFTLLCNSNQEKKILFGKLSYLIFSTKKSCMDKAILMFKSNKTSQSFIKNLAYLDLMPLVSIIGTAQRQAKLFKYTIYIVQIKLKMICQKIFLRYSEVIQIQEDIKKQFPDLQIKQSLMVTTWILNHKPKTIQQRKMNIQRFLKQVLSKPQIIERGQKILFKLGLPFDFYSLPTKLQKDQQSHIFSMKASMKGSAKKSVKKSGGRGSIFRLSVYTVQQQQEEKSKVSRQDFSQNMNLNDLLKANEHLLGHFSQVLQKVDKQVIQNVSEINLAVYVSYLQNIGSGFKKLNFKVQSYQRVQYLISLVAKQLQLNYYKDFRLILQRNYNQRIIDNDQRLNKVNDELIQGEFRLIFKKIIFISHDMQVKQLVHDQMRTRLIASQIIYDVSRGRFNLDYQKYLMLSVLIRVIIEQCNTSVKKFAKNKTQPQENWLARSKQILFPKFTCIQNKQQWDEDAQALYIKVRKIIFSISQENIHEIKRSLIPTSDFLCDLSTLAHFAIIQQMEYHPLYGAYPFMIQATSDFYKKLVKEKSILQENKNLWAAVNYKQVMITSICLSKIYYQFQHRQVSKIQTYPASISIHLKNGKQLIFKTTFSYQIRQFMNYYNHYQGVINRIIKDPLFFQSIILENQRQYKMSIMNQEYEVKEKSMEQKLSKFKKIVQKQKFI